MGNVMERKKLIREQTWRKKIEITNKDEVTNEEEEEQSD